MTSHPETEKVTFRDTKLAVPFFSQYLDVHLEHEQPRACGMTCVYMVLKYFGANASSLDGLITKGEEEGGRGSAGWKHDYLIQTFQQHGVVATREEGMSERSVERFRDALTAGNPVLVSVQRVLFDRRDFHMVVLTGMRESEEGKLEGFFYHDPASLERGTERYVPLASFYLSWRRMAIFPNRT